MYTKRVGYPSGYPTLFVRHSVLFVGFVFGCVRRVRPSTEEGQNRQYHTAENIARYADQKICDGFPREAQEKEIQGVCHRVVEAAKGKDDDREHDADGGGQLFAGRVIDRAYRKRYQKSAQNRRGKRFQTPKLCVEFYGHHRLRLRYYAISQGGIEYEQGGEKNADHIPQKANG